MYLAAALSSEPEGPTVALVVVGCRLHRGSKYQRIEEIKKSGWMRRVYMFSREELDL
jgi:hypothetical protein